MSEFNFLENLPLIIFTLAFFIIFVVFIFGGFVLLTALKDIQRIERGRRILLNSLYALFIILLIALVFFSVTYLLKRGEVLRPSAVPGEFPPSPFANSPPSPKYIKIGEYYFTEPLLLEEHGSVESSAIYAILCKRNEKYDIIYIGEIEEKIEPEEYKCWTEICDQGLKNLYMAIFEMPSEKYGPAQRNFFKEYLKNQINPLCPRAKQGQGAEGA